MFMKNTKKETESINEVLSKNDNVIQKIFELLELSDEVLTPEQLRNFGNCLGIKNLDDIILEEQIRNAKTEMLNKYRVSLINFLEKLFKLGISEEDSIIFLHDFKMYSSKNSMEESDLNKILSHYTKKETIIDIIEFLFKSDINFKIKGFKKKESQEVILGLVIEYCYKFNQLSSNKLTNIVSSILKDRFKTIDLSTLKQIYNIENVPVEIAESLEIVAINTLRKKMHKNHEKNKDEVEFYMDFLDYAYFLVKHCKSKPKEITEIIISEYIEFIEFLKVNLDIDIFNKTPSDTIKIFEEMFYIHRLFKTDYSKFLTISKSYDKIQTMTMFMIFESIYNLRDKYSLLYVLIIECKILNEEVRLERIYLLEKVMILKIPNFNRKEFYGKNNRKKLIKSFRKFKSKKQLKKYFKEMNRNNENIMDLY